MAPIPGVYVDRYGEYGGVLEAHLQSTRRGLHRLAGQSRQIKQVPGRKTDVKACRWIAELLEHGLLRGSFIPPIEIRDLRDLTRYRRQLVNTHSAEVNRLQKVLEDANIKLASVATDVMGVSGRAILRALLAGVVSPEELAELAKGRLRKKKQDLHAALQGRFRPHHTQLLTPIL